MTETFDDELAAEDGASPHAGPAFDERIQFFLRHRVVIQEWASISGDARSASNQWLRTLGPTLQPVAGQLECRPISWTTNAGPYSAFFMLAEDAVFTDGGVPVLGCCLGWNSGRLHVDGVGGYAPFVGVWVARSDPRGRAWRDRFLQEARPVRDLHGYRGSPDWPVWKPVAGGDEWWTALEQYRDQLVEATGELLQRFQSFVETTVRSDTTLEEGFPIDGS